MEPESEEIEDLYDEVDELTNLTDAKDKSDRLIERKGSDRKAAPFIGRLRKAAIIAYRAKQLEEGAPTTLPPNEVTSGDINEIAKRELEKRIIPVKVVLKYPGGIYEVWPISDFKFIHRT